LSRSAHFGYGVWDIVRFESTEDFGGAEFPHSAIYRLSELADSLEVCLPELHDPFPVD